MDGEYSSLSIEEREYLNAKIRECIQTSIFYPSFAERECREKIIGSYLASIKYKEYLYKDSENQKKLHEECFEKMRRFNYLPEIAREYCLNIVNNRR